jgi:hypothetical protein
LDITVRLYPDFCKFLSWYNLTTNFLPLRFKADRWYDWKKGKGVEFHLCLVIPVEVKVIRVFPVMGIVNLKAPGAAFTAV